MRLSLPVLGLSLLALGCGSTGQEANDAEDDGAVSIEAEPSSTGESSASVATRPSASAKETEPLPPNAVEVEATVHVSKEEGKGLVFRGVTLNRADQSPPIIATYSRSETWKAVDGLKVRIVGIPYTPEGRAIMGDHMRIHRLTVVDPKTATSVTSFGPEREMVGSIQVEPGVQGSKEGGEKLTYFVARDGVRYRVFDNSLSKQNQELTGELKLIVRDIELSPTSAHASGPWIWLVGRVREAQ